MIAGLESITDGELFIGQTMVNEIPPKDRDISMVFQSYALYPHMTAYENMEFGLKNRKIKKEEIKKRVQNAAKILEIENLLQRKPKAMSGGQRQRIALGRAMVREPAVFLLDEPLSNLDAKLRTSMRTEIVKLHNRIQTTFVYVTHDQVEAMTMGDKIVVMKDGVIQQVGTPKEIYYEPQNKFVAGFIGTPQMNFLEGSLKKDTSSFNISKEQLFIKLQSYSFPEDDKNVILGIRPEDIKIHPQGKWQGKIQFVENLGNELHITFDVNNFAIQLTSKIPYTEHYRVGDTILFNIAKEKIHLFDGLSGERL